MLIIYLNQAIKKNSSNVSLFGLVIDILTQVYENYPELLKKNSKDNASTFYSFSK